MPHTVVEGCDDEDSPYRLCQECHERLIERALRPIEWGEYPSVDLVSLAQASAACLSFREGFDRVCGALDETEGTRKRDLMFGLSYFRSTEALDWIEKAIFEPITESWAYLAAASNVNRRMRRRLGIGVTLRCAQSRWMADNRIWHNRRRHDRGCGFEFEDRIGGAFRYKIPVTF